MYKQRIGRDIVGYDGYKRKNEFEKIYQNGQANEHVKVEPGSEKHLEDEDEQLTNEGTRGKERRTEIGEEGGGK